MLAMRMFEMITENFGLSPYEILSICREWLYSKRNTDKLYSDIGALRFDREILEDILSQWYRE